MELMEDSQDSGDRRGSAERKSPTPDRTIRQKHKSPTPDRTIRLKHKSPTPARTVRQRHKSEPNRVSGDAVRPGSSTVRRSPTPPRRLVVRKSPTPDEDAAEEDDEDVVLDDLETAELRRLEIQMELKRLKGKQARRTPRRVAEDADDDDGELPAIVQEVLDVQFSSKDDKSCQAALCSHTKVHSSEVGVQTDDDERERVIKAERAKMERMFHIMLDYNDAMGYGVPPKKRKSEAVGIVPPRPGRVPEVVDVEADVRERALRGGTSV